MPDIGATITALRGLLRMTQAELAKRLGVRQPTVSDWESGKVRPSRANLAAVAQALGVTSEDLMNGRVTQRPLGVSEPAPHAVPRKLQIMALDFEKEALAADADENFMRYARARLRDPALFEMYAGGHETRPLTAQEQIDDYAEVIEDLRRLLKKQIQRRHKDSGKIDPDPDSEPDRD